MTMPRRTSNPPVAGSNPTDRTPKSQIGVDDLTTTKPVQHNRIQETTHQQLSAVEAPFSDIADTWRTVQIHEYLQNSHL
jgi:hypothetical protein